MQDLKSHSFDTPLGPMIAIADETTLYLLEFIERKNLKEEIEKLQSPILPGMTKPIESIQQELKLYFEGRLSHFITPFTMHGTPFQKRVWEELQKIPYGQTLSYSELAMAVDNPLGCRAVAGANGTNQLALIIPCHRVINKNGEIGGYGGGVSRKKWLLEHENSI